MGGRTAIGVLAGLALVIAVLAVVGIALPHDPDTGQSWSSFPNFWSGF